MANSFPGAVSVDFAVERVDNAMREQCFTQFNEFDRIVRELLERHAHHLLKGAGREGTDQAVRSVLYGAWLINDCNWHQTILYFRETQP